MNDYISKPVVAESLYSMVSSCLDSSLEPGNEPTIPLGGLINSITPLLLGDAQVWTRELKALADARKFEDISRLAHKIRGACEDCR